MSASDPNREQLIQRLGEDLTPVRMAGKTWHLTLGWLAIAFACAAVLTLINGPIREGAFTELLRTPRYLIENGLGVLAAIIFATAAFRSGIPGIRGQTSLTLIGLALVTAWISMYLAGHTEPAIEASMAGKRHGCLYEIIVFGIPGSLLGLVAVRRLWPTAPNRSAVLVGLSAGIVPAAVMQFGCMYVPMHIVTHHILPGLLLVPIAIIFATFLFRNK